MERDSSRRERPCVVCPSVECLAEASSRVESVVNHSTPLGPISTAKNGPGTTRTPGISGRGSRAVANCRVGQQRFEGHTTREDSGVLVLGPRTVCTRIRRWWEKEARVVLGSAVNEQRGGEKYFRALRAGGLPGAYRGLTGGRSNRRAGGDLLERPLKAKDKIWEEVELYTDDEEASRDSPWTERGIPGRWNEEGAKLNTPERTRREEENLGPATSLGQ